MRPCKGEASSSLLLSFDGSQDLQNIIDTHKETFISYLHQIGVNVSHNSTTTDYQNHSTTILTLKTRCFKVDFNDNLVRISALK